MFFIESPATKIPEKPSERTAFSVPLKTPNCLDVAAPPLSNLHEMCGHLTDYLPCQSLGDAAREADIHVIRYPSVRDPNKRCNLAVLNHRAFSQTKPSQSQQTWHFHLRADVIQVTCENPLSIFEIALADLARDYRVKGWLGTKT